MVAARPAHADSFSAGVSADYLTPEDAAAFSKDIERELAARGARVAIVFRSGRDRSDLPDGVRYTHGSFWVYQPIDTEAGRINGYVSHNLFHGDGTTLAKTRSYLATDFPFEFVAASKVDDVAIIIPTPEMQRRILTMMVSGEYDALNLGEYSLIANPADPTFQNCNEFMLDVVAAAAWETRDYMQIKSNLNAWFKPTVINAGPLMRIFGPLADERLRTDDQRGAIRTVTYASLSAFMLDFGLAEESFVMTRSQVADRTGSAS